MSQRGRPTIRRRFFQTVHPRFRKKNQLQSAWSQQYHRKDYLYLHSKMLFTCLLMMTTTWLQILRVILAICISCIQYQSHKWLNRAPARKKEWHCREQNLTLWKINGHVQEILQGTWSKWTQMWTFMQLEYKQLSKVGIVMTSQIKMW